MSKIKTLSSGVSWGAFSTIAVTGFQLVFMAVMARLLDPASFGLVAIANVSLRFFNYFAQLGTAPALIQKPTLEPGDVAAALAISVVISSFFFGIAQITAPLFEYFFELPGLCNITRVLAINFIIGGFSVVSVGLLRRKAAFRSIAIIDVISYVLGYGLVGLGTAHYGMGVWALVAAFMTQTTLTATLSYIIIRHPLSLKHNTQQRRHFLSYGGRYSIIGFIEFLTSNLDALVVGKLLGATPAGFYNRAILLANLPVQQPANILTKALFPIMSAIGDQHDKQIMSLQLSTLLVGSYAFAVSSGIYFAAPDIVKVLLGDKWLDTIPILEILTWSVGPLYFSHVAGVTLDSLNQLKVKLRIQLSMLFTLIALMLLLAPSGRASDLAMAVVATEWIRVTIMVISLTRILRIPISEMVLILVCITLIGSLSGALIHLTTTLMPSSIISAIRLGLEILAGAVGLLLGGLISRYLAIYLPAIRFLAERSPRFAKFLPKFA